MEFANNDQWYSPRCPHERRHHAVGIENFVYLKTYPLILGRFESLEIIFNSNVLIWSDIVSTGRHYCLGDVDWQLSKLMQRMLRCRSTSNQLKLGNKMVYIPRLTTKPKRWPSRISWKRPSFTSKNYPGEMQYRAKNLGRKRWQDVLWRYVM